MSDWKSRYDVTDQGASNAGVYGTPNSTWDIARAQEESNKLRMSQSSYIAPPMNFSPPPVFGALPTYSTDTRYYGHSDSSGSTGCLKVFAILVVLAAASIAAPVLIEVLGRYIDSSTLARFTVESLDTRHYEGLSAQAVTVAKQPTSRLYATHFRAAAPDWNSMSQKQQTAVAAAWIRYTRNPVSFKRLADHQRVFIFLAFNSYLAALASQGDNNAVKDLEHIRSKVQL